MVLFVVDLFLDSNKNNVVSFTIVTLSHVRKLLIKLNRSSAIGYRVLRAVVQLDTYTI